MLREVYFLADLFSQDPLFRSEADGTGAQKYGELFQSDYDERMKKNAGLLICLGALCLMAGGVYAQTVYECKNAAGVVQFTDKPCQAIIRVVPPPKDTVSPERKAESDARITRDKALGNSSENSRLSREQAGYAAQDQQVQASKTIANTVQQDRTQQSSTVKSVLPASGTTFTPPGQ